MNSESIKNKVFFWGVFLLIATSVGVTYYRYVVALDYFVLLQSSCDPAVESCFLYECDPTVPDAECSEDPADDAYYYKDIKKKAYAVKDCVNSSEGCADLHCQPGEKNCVEVPCDVSIEESGGVCHGPGLILPEEEAEESEEGAEGDEANAESEEPDASVSKEAEEEQGQDGQNKIYTSAQSEAYSTTDWNGYTALSGNDKKTVPSVSFEYPRSWVLEGTVFNDGDGNKIAELLPGRVVLQSGQHCFDTAFKRGEGLDTFISQNPFSVGENKGVKRIFKISEDWYPNSYCVEGGGVAFEISFYENTPNSPQRELFDKIISTVTFSD